MCLAKLSPKKPTKRGFGYKVFMIGAPDGRVTCSCQLNELPKNRWVKAERRPLITDMDDVPYTSGFHIFTKLSDARLYQSRWPDEAIYRVEYRGAHTQGFQHYTSGYQAHAARTPVVVADQIRVLRKVASK